MKKIIIIALVTALVFFTLGYLIGTTKVNPTNQLAKGANTYQAGWEAAKQRMVDFGFYPLMDKTEFKSIYGQVKEVNNKAVTLKIKPLEPLADPSLDERIVEIDANTKIYINQPREQKEYQQAMEDYDKKLQEQVKIQPDEGGVLNTDKIMPPEPYTKKLGNFSDIKVGAELNIIALDNDIKNIKQFKAAEIIIQEAPAAVQPETPEIKK